MNRIIKYFERIAAYYAKKHEREIAQAQLYRMSDRELHDIGISRGDIRNLV
jgi:uncharacterized protein YjiS (DUF1127 family)